MSGTVSLRDPSSSRFRSLEVLGRVPVTRSNGLPTFIRASSSLFLATAPRLTAKLNDAPMQNAELASGICLSSTAPASDVPKSMKIWGDQHLFMLSTIYCMAGAAMTALFVAAIPTLLAFKKAVESMEKLLEVTREELPGTMAAVRLSWMEISDLTMELSELGHEISSGVKSSARAVRAAQDGLRRVSSIASKGRHAASRVNEHGGAAPSKGSP